MNSEEFKRLVDKTTNDNYAVFLAFDVVDGSMTPEEFYKKIYKHKN